MFAFEKFFLAPHNKSYQLHLLSDQNKKYYSHRVGVELSFIDQTFIEVFQFHKELSGNLDMVVKGKKKEKNKKNGENKKKKPAKRSTMKTGKKEGRSKSRCQVDVFNEHAVENAYYTCHNVMDILKIRGFPWPELAKKKKKGKRK